jgi:hypothetical protein
MKRRENYEAQKLREIKWRYKEGKKERKKLNDFFFFQ